MKMRNVLVAGIAASTLAVATLAHGAEQHAPWERACKSFQTPRQFVVESTLFCLRNPTTKQCHDQAAKRFKGCRFSGDYKKMSGKVQAKMLVVLALSGGASWRQGDSM